MIRTGHLASLLAGPVLVGCFVGCFVDKGVTDVGETGTSTTGVASTSGAPTTGTGGAASDDSGTSTEGGQTESCGLTCGSTGEPGESCDVRVQDCPEGHKCAPYSSDEDNTWDAAKCVPTIGMGAPGDPCKSEGPYSGIDDCQAGALCWDPGVPERAVCVALCQGSQSEPKCPAQPESHCMGFDAGTLELCLPICDPLVQDCANGHLCIPLSEEFVCMYDASGAGGATFDPCERVNGCDIGLLCLNPSAGTECDPNASGCCLPLCSLSDPILCPGAGQSCMSLYPEGMAPADHEDVGVCAVSS